MADVLDDGEFWLPSQFLSDDDWLLEKEYMKTVTNDHTNSQKGFAKDVFGVPYNFPADLSSPVESASTETDEEDYAFLAGLSRQLDHSTLHANDLSSFQGWSARPVSGTAVQAGTGCGCKPANCRGSTTKTTWDLLYAAGEVAKMKLDEEKATYGSRASNGGLFVGPTPDIALYQKLQALKFQQLRQQQILKRHQQQQQQGVVAYLYHLHHKHQSVQGASSLAGPAASPFSRAQHLQKHSPVFLGNLPAKKERTGTGVFLPRRAATPAADTRKKSAGSSTVLNVEDMSGSQQLHPMFPADNAVYYPASRSVPCVDSGDLRLRSGDFLGGSNGKRSFRSQPPVISSSEVGLPQEWTY